MKPQARQVTIKHGKTSRHFSVRDLADWQDVAVVLAGLIHTGLIITLQGPLGAGKTTLVQYLARTIGTPKRAISPTFALIRIYRSPKNDLGIERLVHVDAYRIEDEKDLVVLDLDEELREPGTVVLIEWPENVKAWLTKKHPVKVLIDY